MNDGIKVLNDGNFEAETAAGLVLADFYAEWCRPCHMLAPTVAEIAQDYSGRIRVVKVNVDEAMNTAARLGIRGIPTLILFKDGQQVDRPIVGAVPREQITEVLDRYVPAAS
jgi:thioredoxin 1